MSGAGNAISLVIPNWNGMAHLPTCLNSVALQSLLPDEVIVVDNGSTDGSVEFLERKYPWIRTIGREENSGFARAVNLGITGSSGAFIALLNNDTELDPLWLAELVRALRQWPEAGSAAGKMLDFGRRDVIDGAGDALTRGCAPLTRGAGEPDDGRYGREEFIFGACAGAALYRRSLFEAIGTFDEDFISYYEDQDLAFRAQLAGFKCIYVPSAVCYHKRGATANTIRHYPVRMQERNLTSLHLKNLPWTLLLLRGPAIAVSRFRRIWRAARAGLAGPTLRGLAEGLTLVPRMLVKRRAIQRMRKIPVQEVRKFMGGSTS